ncbi:MAG TPA: metallophosphoesterase [Candidatus Methanoperedens sp.]
MSSTAKKSGFMNVTKIGYVILGILVILLALAAAIHYYSTSSFSGITAISASSGITPMSASPSITAMSGSSFRFVVWADTKTGTSILQSESQSIISIGLNPAFTLYPGDLCNSGPDATCFATWKSALNGGNTNNLFNITFATRGNHDSAGGAYWQSAFDFAATATAIGATNYVEQTTDMTYSFDYGNSHFVGIDVPGGDVSTITSTQITWLDNDLTDAESRGLTHAFLFWHGPIYYVDEHPSTPSSSLITVLNKHPIVSAAFFGHEHVVTYTHIDSSRISTITHPFEEFISGGAGAQPYVTNVNRVDYCIGKNGSTCPQLYGYMSVDVSGNKFNVSFYKQDGTLDKLLTFH